jgi:hypothetical protein
MNTLYLRCLVPVTKLDIVAGSVSTSWSYSITFSLVSTTVASYSSSTVVSSGLSRGKYGSYIILLSQELESARGGGKPTAI